MNFRETILISFILISSLTINCLAKQTKTPIRLITWAHDMGISHDVNKGIIKSYRDGIIRNASLMVPCPYFDEAVKMCKANPGLSVGIHVTLVGIDPIRPVLDPDEIPTLVRPDGFSIVLSRLFQKQNHLLRILKKKLAHKSRR